MRRQSCSAIFYNYLLTLSSKTTDETKRIIFIERDSTMRTTIGIDFGTLSARALLLDIDSGQELACGVCEYPQAVITTHLPDGTPLPHNFALQDPQDYLTALEQSIAQMFRNTTCPPSTVTAIGIDFTSSTVIPVRADGTPLCFLQEFRQNPHAWCKLWKHHGAGEQAQRMTELAIERDESWLSSYGGKVSSEYLLPKLLETLEKAPEVYAAADLFVEAGDWLTWQLTGTLCRSNCGAGFKSFHDPQNGFPSVDYLSSLNKEFALAATTKLSGSIKTVGDISGYLTPEWAKRLGLPAAIPVAVSVIDAHASLPGCGIADAGKLLMIIGTSTCHIVLDSKKQAVTGANGVVKDGIVPGLYAYEAGQCCVGDSFSWYIDNCLPYNYVCEAKEQQKNLHVYLREKASRLRVGESGLVVLDWLNGVRSPLMDFDLSSALIGLKLSTKPEEIYRAFIEATAFGGRTIMQGFIDSGISIHEVYATGGIASKDDMTMQIYADILGLPVRIAGGRYSGSRGSAIYAAYAAESLKDPALTLQNTVHRLGDCGTRIFTPIATNTTQYNKLYEIYQQAAHYFGIQNRTVMRQLKEIKEQQ